MAILGVLQSQHKATDISETIEQALVMGLRRAAGFNLLNFAMDLSGDEQIFFDML